MNASTQIHAHIPDHLPTYVRTRTLHHGNQPFEADSRTHQFL